ncbi:MAG: hypothetical protein SynsKO_09210 [Synoicihabitans sp.]
MESIAEDEPETEVGTELWEQRLEGLSFVLTGEFYALGVSSVFVLSANRARSFFVNFLGVRIPGWGAPSLF